MKNKKRGFTLIELLVVVAIIGLLASIILVSLSKARESARDAKRLSEARSIQNALELYHFRNKAYPASNGTAAQTQTMFGTLVAQGFLPQLPSDPIYGTDWPLYRAVAVSGSVQGYTITILDEDNSSGGPAATTVTGALTCVLPGGNVSTTTPCS